jgi:hypothetical protein
VYFLLLIFSFSVHAQFKPQVVNSGATSSVSPAPAAASPSVDPATKAAPALPQGMNPAAQQGQQPPKAGGGSPSPQDISKPPGSQGPFSNGAGPTGTNWYSGDQSTGATPGTFDMNGSGMCGDGQDMWKAVGNVMQKGVLPPNQSYNINAPNWAKISPAGDSCNFGPGKASMCTSATAAAFCQHISDLTAKGLRLTPQQIEFLNGPQVKALINGNTFSMAYLYQYLGGASLHGSGGNIQSVLAQAKTGDVLKIDRTNKTGHSTIFKEVKGNQVCYWSSNTATRGTGVQCENISSLTNAVISRFPSDLGAIPGRIDQMRSSIAGINASQANAMKAGQVKWAAKLECTNPPSLQKQANNESSTTTPPPANR